MIILLGCQSGIIPTRVGTSDYRPSFLFFLVDHPHACGDKFLHRKRRNAVWGSSPRVWGQAVCRYHSVFESRIIPTRVGTSYHRISCNTCHWDHPHACGDKLSISSRICATLGSSPRVWGQGPQLSAARQAARIIPTRVGTSTKLYQT